MRITVEQDDLRVTWHPGTSMFHVELDAQEVAVWTSYGNDQTGEPPTIEQAVQHMIEHLEDGSARELAQAEIDAR